MGLRLRKNHHDYVRGSTNSPKYYNERAWEKTLSEKAPRDWKEY